jgi:hypothetical protein
VERRALAPIGERGNVAQAPGEVKTTLRFTLSSVE